MKTTATTEKVTKAPKMKGVVVSNKMVKTIVVNVDTIKAHPKYLKQYRSSKKYKVHVEDASKYAVGDVVVIQECRPMSRHKRHSVVSK
jgi:small subunit ribosomal protein S17